jgi:predicted transcriptional regulator of viral defense system
MATRDERKAQVLEAVSGGRPVRYAELRAIAKSYAVIQELLDEGRIERMATGMYGIPGRDESWNSFAMLATRQPDAVICLASAAAYHGLTTQNPFEVWAAFPYGKTSIPKSSDLTVRGFRWRGASMEVGIDTVDVGGVPVRITSPARTVVDLIRTKGRTGEDEVAMEALRGFAAGGKVPELLKLAKALGCEAKIRPYTEAAMGFRGPR